MSIRTTLFLTLAVLALYTPVHAQRGRGGQAQAPPTPKAAAPVDLTGYWVSVVTEDWKFRMVTPKKGEYGGMPLNPEGRRVADTWDPAKDEAAGNQCKAYGAAAIMRVPGHLHIAWENDNTLRVDMDAGTQTRLLRFGGSAARGEEPSWQGSSAAQWQAAGGAGPVRNGNLKVVTTGMRPGYLRKNGVPYSGNAVLTEYYERIEAANGDQFLIVISTVDDPLYLTSRFLTSTQFKKLREGAAFKATPCSAK